MINRVLFNNVVGRVRLFAAGRHIHKIEILFHFNIYIALHIHEVINLQFTDIEHSRFAKYSGRL